MGLFDTNGVKYSLKKNPNKPATKRIVAQPTNMQQAAKAQNRRFTGMLLMLLGLRMMDK